MTKNKYYYCSIYYKIYYNNKKYIIIIYYYNIYKICDIYILSTLNIHLIIINLLY